MIIVLELFLYGEKNRRGRNKVLLGVVQVGILEVIIYLDSLVRVFFWIFFYKVIIRYERMEVFYCIVRKVIFGLKMIKEFFKVIRGQKLFIFLKLDQQGLFKKLCVILIFYDLKGYLCFYYLLMVLLIIDFCKNIKFRGFIFLCCFVMFFI